MVDRDMQEVYVQMWVECLHVLTTPRLPHKVRFVRGIDDDEGAYVLCVVMGPEREDGPAEIVGCIRYANGLAMTPAEVNDEARGDIVALFEN